MNTSARPRAPSAFAFPTSRRHTVAISATFKRISAVPPPTAYTEREQHLRGPFVIHPWAIARERIGSIDGRLCV